MRSLVRVARQYAQGLSLRPMPVLAAALAGMLGIAQGGCSLHTAPVTISGVEVLEHTPTIALDVENDRGAVLIKVNPKLTAPRVNANAGTLRGEPVENYQGDKWVTAAITETDGRAIFKVRNTAQPGDATRWVQMMIEVPSCDGLRVKNSDGVIEAHGINGAITVENGGAGRPGGPVLIEGGKPNTSPITITSASGDVELLLPTDSTGEVQLISGNGALAAMIAFTGQVNNSVIKPGWYSGILNWGTNPIRIKSTEGEVKLRVGPYRVGNPQIKYYKEWYFSKRNGAADAVTPS